MQTDRRQTARHQLTRPFKLRTAAGGRYLAGRTMDVSAGGALLEIQHPGVLVAGQVVQLGIAWDRSHALLAADHMVEARVMRCLNHNGMQKLAVQFNEPIGLKATA